MMAARTGLVSPHPLPGALIEQVQTLFPGSVASTPPADGFYAMALTTTIQADTGPDLRARLRAAAEAYAVDASLVWGRLAARGPGLIVLDVDSTLITAEVIELLAAHAGSEPLVTEITERAMRGEIDFSASLAERVATLKGLPVAVIDEVRAAVQLAPGARDLIRAAHHHGTAVGLVSGGFAEIVDPLATSLGIHLIAANRLAVTDGHLTGHSTGPVIDRAAKRHHLLAYAEHLGVSLDRVVAVGDGANDLDMLDVAALGVAYCAKPVTRAAADAAISFPRLDAVRVFLGL